MPTKKLSHKKPKPSRDLAAERAYAKLRHSRLTPAERLERSWKQSARPPKSSITGQNFRRGIAHRALRAWADLNEMYRTYMAAAIMCELTGETYTVDHIVPLISPLVCGLHTHDNLTIISAGENRLKSNVYWPDMWELDWDTFAFLLAQGQYGGSK